MDNESGFLSSMKAIANTAKGIETKWKAKDTANTKLAAAKPSMGTGTGDYREMGWKQGDPSFSWSTCYRCNAQNMSCERLCAGCRHNGDGYGTDVSYCKTCGFLAWDSYDEA